MTDVEKDFRETEIFFIECFALTLEVSEIIDSFKKMEIARFSEYIEKINKMERCFSFIESVLRKEYLKFLDHREDWGPTEEFCKIVNILENFKGI